jgi:hypothetical protein
MHYRRPAVGGKGVSPIQILLEIAAQSRTIE